MADGGQNQHSGVADVTSTSLVSGTKAAALAEGEYVTQKFTKCLVKVQAGDNIHGNKIVNQTLSAGGEETTKDQVSATLAQGGNVNQVNEDSSVVVTAGDQVHGNKMVNNITIIGGEASHSTQKNISVLIQSITCNTMQKTKERILEDFGAEELRPPDFEVNPQMRRVKGSGYFKGKYEHVQEMVVKTKTGWFRKQKTQVIKNQFRKEFGFFRKQLEDRDYITLGEIFQADIDDNSVTAIVASAGSGKTTLMRRMARRSCENSFANHATTSGSRQSNYKLVHYVEVKDIQCSESIKPSKFLFGGMFQNVSDEEHMYEWMLKNPSESILFFDGLDQAKWQINSKANKKINPFSSADSATIMCNILSRNILPRVKVVISSREFQISDLPAEARPEDIITLSGLSLDDAKNLFVFLIGQDGAKAWKMIQRMSPRLLNLVSIPVFLVLTAVIMSKDPTKPPPKTITELYKIIISTLSDVKNIINADDIAEIIKKLKAMAYRGMKEGRVVFYKKDLKMFGISKEDVRDLMMKVPGNKLLSRNLVEGDFIFFFCHQSLQEFLAAEFVAEMAIRKFISFNHKHLHTERWSVVRRFVCGIIYDNSPNQLHKVPNRLVKQQVIAQSILRRLLKDDDNRYICMELYTAIYESNDKGLMKRLSVIDACGVALSRDEAHIVGSLASCRRSLISLNLSNCKMNDEVLAIITGCLEDQIEVKEVDLRDNKFSGTALRSLLGHRRIESLSGNLDWKVARLDDIQLRNEEDVIEISSAVEGHFNIEESMLVFKCCYHIRAAAYLEILFGAKGIQFPEHLYVKYKNLWELSKSKLEIISKILVDCTEEEIIVLSLIGTFSKNDQIAPLDIAVNGQTSADDYNRILERGKEISVFIKIHAMFYVGKGDNSGSIVKACQRNKIEYIRCIFDKGCRASLDEISSLVKNSHSKKVTLLYKGKDDMLNGDELTKVKMIANDLDTELEVTKLQVIRLKSDAWELLDYTFYARSMGLKKAMVAERKADIENH